MKLALVLAFIALSAFAHPDGTYKIDGDKDVTATFRFIERCPQVTNALPGRLRTIVFSEKAQDLPYEFKSGYFVEIHEGSQEIYVQTNEQCVPFDIGARYPASRVNFNGYTLEKI